MRKAMRAKEAEGSYFQIFCFEILVLRGPYFQRWQKGSSFSGELKLILMMYYGLSLQKKMFFLWKFIMCRFFSFFFFFGGGCMFTMEVASFN